MELAKKQKDGISKENLITERYVMPDSGKDLEDKDKTPKRYEPEKPVRSEQEQWELDQ